MRADWLNDFREALKLLTSEMPQVNSAYIYHRSGGQWRNGNETFKEGQALFDVAGARAHAKVGNTKRYIFPLPEEDILVELVFHIFPKTAKLTATRAKIVEIRDNTRHRFDALHDSLTGCKNRKSFEIDIQNIFSSLPNQDSSTGELLAQGGANSVTLVSFDIDHFKKINDSRGHEYGDLVLRAFSWTVQDICESLETSNPNVEFVLYRLGGEEFSILIAGSIDERSTLQCVDDLRSQIERAVIPADAQAEVFGIPKQSLPPVSERKATASFGISRIDTLRESDKLNALDRLKNHADKALYSSKNSGRNCSRFFPDILKRFGRIIEHDKDSGVIVIDIGTDVGVEKGREFFVIPEKYTGSVPYMVDDGRSRRTLGKYPRIKNAKIVAFNVQSEISFCSITERREGVEIVKGAFLESIPLGLFGGLSGMHGNAELPSEIDIKLDLERWIAANPPEQRRVLSIRFCAIREVEASHGSIKANSILASAATSLKKILPPPLKFSQPEVGQFGVAFYCNSDQTDTLLSRIKLSLLEVCSEIVDFQIGLFDEEVLDLEGQDESTTYKLDASFSYDYATIAAAAAKPNSFLIFDAIAPKAVMRENYASRQYEKLLSDYEKFFSIGIIDGELENLAGLACYLNGDAESSIRYFRSAITYKPDNSAFNSNLAIALYRTGNLIEAYEILAIEFSPSEIPPNVKKLLGMYAICALASYNSGSEPKLADLVAIFEQAEALKEYGFVGEQNFLARKKSVDAMRSNEMSN